MEYIYAAMLLHSAGKEINEENILSDERGNYAYLTFGGKLHTPKFLNGIDENKCLNCFSCVEVCETRTIGEDGRLKIVSPEICHGCAHCVKVCPSGAVIAKEISREEMVKRFKAFKEKQF